MNRVAYGASGGISLGRLLGVKGHADLQMGFRRVFVQAQKGSGQAATIKWSPIDIGTFVWYKASIWSGAKVLILRMLLGLSDNPPLGTIFNTTQDNREYLPTLRKM
jgi:hypothetical protein